MGKRFKRILLWIMALLLLTIGALIYFSPFNDEKGKNTQVMVSIQIDMPVDSVFSFMGNSDNVANWSVYVDHISTLNPNEFPDGVVGSLRRCFCYPDENEQYWDEEIVEVIQNQKRKLKITNLVDFPMEANGLMTEQLVEKINNNSTKLSLTVYFSDNSASNWDWFKMKLGAYEIQRIFKENLANIKKIIEAKND